MAQLNGGFLKLASGYLFPEIARRVKVWSENHPNTEIIRLGVGNTTEPLGKYIANAMINKIERLKTVEGYTGYGDEQGDTPLRKALSNFYKTEYNVDLLADEFFVSDGAKSDSANIQSIFGSNCIIAVQDPSYPVYVDSNVASGRSRGYNEEKGNYYEFIYMDANEKTGFIPEIPKRHVDLIYLCFPNNPTGAVATKNQLREFVQYALRENAVIIYDAAYSDYVRTPGIVHSIYEIEDAKKCAIEINSLSKNAGFTGVRCGWSVVPKEITTAGKIGEVHRLWNRRQCTFFNGASNIAQAGALAALNPEGRAECKALVDYYLENAHIIREGLEDVGLKCTGGIDSPYVWTKVPNNFNSWQFFDYLLENAHVVVTPGSGFGTQGEGYVRVSAYGHRENIIKGVRMIKENIR